jgi:hypothetical protein
MWRAAWMPTAVNFGFLYRIRYFPFKELLNYPHEAEWTPFQTHNFSGNLVAVVLLSTDKLKVMILSSIYSLKLN